MKNRFVIQNKRIYARYSEIKIGQMIIKNINKFVNRIKLYE